MSDQIFTVVKLKAKFGKLEELKSVISTLTKETRKEAGVLEYLIVEDAMQPNTIFSIEKWQSADAESKHWETTHLQHALSQLGELLEEEASISKGYQAF